MCPQRGFDVYFKFVKKIIISQFLKNFFLWWKLPKSGFSDFYDFWWISIIYVEKRKWATNFFFLRKPSNIPRLTFPVWKTTSYHQKSKYQIFSGLSFFEIFVLKFEIFSNIRNLRKYWNSFLKQINDAMTLETSSTSNSRWKLKFCLLFFENTNFCDFFLFFEFRFFLKICDFFAKMSKNRPCEVKIICSPK